ncbi:MAG: T9SS type A sorting domain-containing protein, partial [Ignavibacteriaceae bacterium]
PYGYRNLGNNAIYENINNGTYGTVLLNQPYGGTTPYYSIRLPSSITIGGLPHNIYLQSWNFTGVQPEFTNQLETAIVFINPQSSITAKLKATQLSDNQNAFVNNSSRKFIKTTDGVMHIVYESLSHVWYETSTDQGTTWQLMNNGQPLDNGEAKEPSIDFSNNSVAIVYQQKNGNNYTIQLKAFLANGSQYLYNYGTTLYTESSGLYSSDANPVIAFSSAGKIVVLWQKTSGLYYLCAGLGINPYSPSYTYYDGSSVNATNNYSKLPTVAVDKYSVGNEVKFQLAWEQGNTSGQSSIYYCPITLTYGTPPLNLLIQPDSPSQWYSTQGTVQNISTGSSYSYNHSPSIIAGTDGYARICWSGQYLPGWNSYVVFRGSNNSRFWYFGTNIRTPQLTFTNDYLHYFVIWNEIYGNYTKFTDNSTLRDIYDLNTTGQAVQLSNGSDVNSMYASVYNNQTQPYFFKRSPSIGSVYGLHKSGIASNISIGRGASIVKDSTGFFFILKNITVNNQGIDFIKVADTTKIDNISDLNKCLISQPFALTTTSDFSYEIINGITSQDTNKSSESNALGKNNSVSYKLDLIDAGSGKILGNLGAVEFNNNNLTNFEDKVYKIDLKGIEGSRQVQLRITSENNFNGRCSLIDSYSDTKPDNLQKENTKEINYEDLYIVKDYGLDQNYPNPFNPATTISYQLPKDGLVTLKIYDMLGREVATLVNNEQKSVGRYNVNYNAGNLASGVYIYQLKVNDLAGGDGYTSTKKLMLLK